MLKNEVIIKRKKSILQEKDKSIKKRKRERERGERFSMHRLYQGRDHSPTNHNG